MRWRKRVARPSTCKVHTHTHTGSLGRAKMHAARASSAGSAAPIELHTKSMGSPLAAAMLPATPTQQQQLEFYGSVMLNRGARIRRGRQHRQQSQPASANSRWRACFIETSLAAQFVRLGPQERMYDCRIAASERASFYIVGLLKPALPSCANNFALAHKTCRRSEGESESEGSR